MADPVEYATTFEFSQRDYEEIFDGGEDLMMPRDGTSDDMVKKLDHLSQKEVRLDLHRKTLCNYYARKIIPRGLRIQKQPTLCKDNEQFSKRWTEILNKCSIDLMALIVNEIKSDLVKIRKDIETTTSELLEKVTDIAKCNETIENIKKMQKELEAKLTANKQKKFQRDEADYKNKEVYFWQKKQTPRSGRPKPRWPNRSNPATSESDYTSDGSLNAHPFLDPRPQPNNRGRGRYTRRPGVARGEARPNQRDPPWTRSRAQSQMR